AAWNDLDLSVDKMWRFSGMQFRAALSLFHTLDRQRALAVDERFSFDERNNANVAPTNASFGLPIVKTTPRELRLELSLSF
ncbi:MAG TPA: hypothetical protein VN181_13725, partial [Thermoanaerobaculia bacterium]|nr:hypothetical protein [Thermoanaerobaculia bacterium]